MHLFIFFSRILFIFARERKRAHTYVYPLVHEQGREGTEGEADGLLSRKPVLGPDPKTLRS